MMASPKKTEPCVMESDPTDQASCAKAATQKKPESGVMKPGPIDNASCAMAATQKKTEPGPTDNLQASCAMVATQKKPEPGLTDNTSYNCTELLEALKSIQKVIQCYTCHKPLNSTKICISGHAFCYNCKRRCNSWCPICREVILGSKPEILNDLIKVLPRSCNFSSKGCDSLVLPHDNGHENFCRFRRTYCRFPNCDWKGIAKDLLLHLEKVHGKDIIRTHTQTTILMSFNAAINREGLAVIVAFNNIFWRHVKINQNRLLEFYQYVPMEKPTKKYMVQISFHTQEASYSSTTPVHTDIFDPAQLFTDKQTFALPKKTALSFNRFHSGVHYTFKIIRLDI